VIDSVMVGAAKPDPAIFRAALERCATDAAGAVHIGDMVSADVAGARAAGIEAIHLDPARRCRATDHRHVRTLKGIWRHISVHWTAAIWGRDPIVNLRAVADYELVDTHREARIRRLRELIERHAYEVDPTAVADAIVERELGVALAHEYRNAPVHEAAPRTRPRTFARGRGTGAAAA
jgi:HAD-hyrolase-like/Anti-sigma-28 factor, FlgM